MKPNRTESRFNLAALFQKKNLSILFLLFLLPVFIYCYFLKWRTDAIYGDDLHMFKEYLRLNGFWEKMNMPVNFGKYRPVHGLSVQLIMEWFHKNLEGYYLFNIGIQSLNTFLFALLLNLFLKSPVLSLLLSLSIGVSRFALFNITQLFNGGALEGLAITFFLLSLYFLVRAVVKAGATVEQKQKWVVLSIVMANLSLYTHERYIVLLPFLMLTVFLIPGLRGLPLRQRVKLGGAAAASLVLNVVLKKYVYSLPFFMGTASTEMAFSFETAFSFLIEAILSMFQINSGPEYLVGLPFSSLPPMEKALVIFLAIGILGVFAAYLRKAKAILASGQEEERSVFYIFLFLLPLFALLLAPAVVTIRLEQRWLQASFCVLLLLLAIAFSRLQFRSRLVRNYSFAAFLLLFLWSDYNYLRRGGNNIYLMNAETLASHFKEALDKGVIREHTAKLYIWEKKRDANTESAINWSLGGGYFFDFYELKPKEIVFVDSIYRGNYGFAMSSFGHFNRNTEQIIFIHDRILDLSREYLQDSLKSFQARDLNTLAASTRKEYKDARLLIGAKEVTQYGASGFHDYEGGFRWTNGKAELDLMGDFTVTDSATVELNTYMPPVCAHIVPRVVLIGDDLQEYVPASIKRDGDKFSLNYRLGKTVVLQKVKILSETIKAAPPDTRVLSFPFISMELKR